MVTGGDRPSRVRTGSTRSLLAMTAAHRPRAVAVDVDVDVNETLFSPGSFRVGFVALGLSTTSVHWWFAVLLRDGFGLATTADALPFAQLARHAVSEELDASRIDTSSETIESALASLSELDPHPDVMSSLAVLGEARSAAFALTTSGDRTATGLVGTLVNQWIRTSPRGFACSHVESDGLGGVVERLLDLRHP
jgi:hypothetical protein